jgi:hypothetical protein
MSANQYVVEPELPTPFPNIARWWTCPITGIKVPKDPDENLQWRAKLLRMAEEDPQLQQDLYTACSKSILFFVNAFVFTFRVFEADTDTVNMGRIMQSRNADVPFVTWEIQDRHIKKLEHAIDNAYSLLTDKSRDMGASWDHCVVFHHQLIFRKNSLFLELSRVETDVDGSDNPRALFVKHDYINKWLPEWMRPNIKRTNMHIVNMDNGSRIDGESSNKAAGSGDRRKACLLDEMAKMENARKIKAALRDVSPCLLPNSTPWGPGTAYTEWMLSGQIEVFAMSWWDHPEKGRGRYCKREDDTGKWKIRSPYYDLQETIRDPKEMAQELDRDHIGSGDIYFDPITLEEHAHLFCRDAKISRHFDFRKEVTTQAMPALIHRKALQSIVATPNGSWRIWCPLIKGRPDQTKDYVFGIDISKGMGASNSVVSVMCVQTREVIAEYANAKVAPHDLARIVCAAAIWFGGSRNGGRPLMVWEAQGPGWDFGRQIMKVYQYPTLYFDRQVRTHAEKRTNKGGWHSTNEKKEIMLGMLRRAYSHGGIIHHSQEAIDEAKTYIYMEGGSLGPAGLMEESANARKTHGDRVISAGLCVLGIDDTYQGKPVKAGPPWRSVLWRKNQRKREQRKARKDATLTFDWRQHAS